MADFRPDLKAQLEALDTGFSSFRDILMQLYTQDLALGLTPDVAKLQSATSEYVTLHNLLTGFGKITHSFSQDVPREDGTTTTITFTKKKINLYELSDQDVHAIVDRLRGIFKYLIEESQSYVK